VYCVPISLVIDSTAFANSLSDLGELSLLNGGFNLLKIRRKVRSNLNFVVERDVEELAARMRRPDQSQNRLLRPTDLGVVLHAVAVVEQDAKGDRLFRVRKELDLLRYAVIENGKVFRFQTPHIAPPRVRNPHSDGHKVHFDPKSVLDCREQQEDDERKCSHG
jgi:hypothetical protein